MVSVLWARHSQVKSLHSVSSGAHLNASRKPPGKDPAAWEAYYLSDLHHDLTTWDVRRAEKQPVGNYFILCYKDEPSL